MQRLTRNLEREIERCKQDGQEDPPSEQVDEEGQSTGGNQEVRDDWSGHLDTLGQVPVCTCQAAEGGNQ